MIIYLKELAQREAFNVWAKDGQIVYCLMATKYVGIIQPIKLQTVKAFSYAVGNVVKGLLKNNFKNPSPLFYFTSSRLLQPLRQRLIILGLLYTK